MVFWDVNALVEKLRNGSLTEKQKMIYFLIYSVIYLTEGFFNDDTSTVPQIFGFAVMIIVQIIIAVVCFQANNYGDGKNFLERFICLQVPLSIRFWVVIVPAAILFQVVGTQFFNISRAAVHITSNLLLLVALWIYVTYLRDAIAKVAALPADADLTAEPPATG